MLENQTEQYVKNMRTNIYFFQINRCNIWDLINNFNEIMMKVIQIQIFHRYFMHIKPLKK